MAECVVSGDERKVSFFMEVPVPGSAPLGIVRVEGVLPGQARISFSRELLVGVAAASPGRFAFYRIAS
ncbi:hypothetical protein OIU85_009634 [Salix viminalis]|uniref:Uncharacterized protein n=1 Tax=Salix viminalis TaxID=40686 RepID=A0A9Q0SFY3_SALVM|nr:hypothetical protein OIU85_009634 [Salix viminalis]